MSLHQLVIDAAVKDPDNLAVVGPDGALTYGSLDRRADALAARLRAVGVGRGDRVIIWADKSPTVVVAMQAVLRMAAAYVPCEGTTPSARVATIARDCQARAVLTTPEGMAHVRAALGADVTCLPLTVELTDPADPVNQAVNDDDLAYILYTSGSTGTPKGVCISHGNARAFVDWVVDELRPGPQDRFANHAPLTFDLSVLDLYAAFAAGACVHLIAGQLAYAPTQLVEFLHREKISIWYSVPSALALMIRDGRLLDGPPPGPLRAVLFAGEPFPITYVRRLADWTPARLLNLYGPTETNVCTFHEVAPDDLDRILPVPIGRATCGDRVWAQRPDGGIADPGQEGELVVDGPTVMLGYWGRPRHQGPYPTGDIVRVLPGDVFEYVGRRDQMVKVRGHRIELGEVEAALTAHGDVAEAGVVVVGAGMDAQLTAFVVPQPGRQPGVLALKGHCAVRLPRYMLPDQVRLLARLPRTGNGKLDRVGLTTLASQQAAPPETR
ncbi:amino acid adenylation domain-containing protein [Micromonospora sp. NPDC048843]|uniref:amino acid adenylation domain-containing protein n=1 Tax=Micromonospora sp. NPDC048843 TaxID=3155389 RepID=UPI0033EC4C2E